MTNVKFKKPTRGEAIAIMFMLFAFFGIFQSAQLYLALGDSWRPHLWAEVTLSGAVMFWLFFFVFHISMMFVMARSVLTKTKSSTWNGYDFTIGFMMIIGLYFIVISTLYGVFKGEQAIEFLFNIKYSILLNIGFAIEAIGMLWYAMTD